MINISIPKKLKNEKELRRVEKEIKELARSFAYGNPVSKAELSYLNIYTKDKLTNVSSLAYFRKDGEVIKYFRQDKLQSGQMHENSMERDPNFYDYNFLPILVPRLSLSHQNTAMLHEILPDKDFKNFAEWDPQAFRLGNRHTRYFLDWAETISNSNELWVFMDLPPDLTLGRLLTTLHVFFIWQRLGSSLQTQQGLADIRRDLQMRIIDETDNLVQQLNYSKKVRLTEKLMKLQERLVGRLIFYFESEGQEFGDLTEIVENCLFQKRVDSGDVRIIKMARYILYLNERFENLSLEDLYQVNIDVTPLHISFEKFAFDESAKLE